MNYAKTLFLALSGIGGLTSSFASGDDKPAQSKPNVLVVLVDQWRGEALGVLKQEPVITPHLDSLAGKSLVLAQTITNYPLCSPSRATLMTGNYPLKNNVYSNVNSKSTPYGVELPTDMTCWSDVLKANGYSTGYIGKWHLDAPHEPYIPTSNNMRGVAWNEWTPPNRRHGFDYWYAYGTYDEHDMPMYWDTHAGRDDFHYVKQWEPEHDVDKAIEFLKNTDNSYRDNRKPFSLVVSINPPHSPYNRTPEKYVDRYKDIPDEAMLKEPNIPAAGTEMGDFYRKNIREYYAAMTGVDEQVGRLLGQLRASGLSKNTIVIFMADHGNCLGMHDEVSKNVIYEESVRIPFIIHWEGHIMPAIDHTLLFTVADIYPTLLDMLPLQNRLSNTVEGTSYAGYFLKRKDKLPAVQYFMGSISPSNKDTGFRGVRNTNYKLAYETSGKTKKVYLFDLQKDPFELNNISNEKKDVVAALTKQLKAWLAKTNDPFTLPD
ncbi:sulfatase [Pedobacter sp. BS3]|uniref:sulfatase family protein n=1 Tax=Pedobacter sp. BS3 TaxID=2567937 RepID=UPI0011EC2135|nr:sulfatase [Pedobacter sp. BS3]TZF82588.1 sulfatase [Pedobacter sp. BS3]